MSEDPVSSSSAGRRLSAVVEHRRRRASRRAGVGPLAVRRQHRRQPHDAVHLLILAVMWNALAGYAGLVSVGQQAFFGLGAYFAIQLSDHGVGVYPALVLGALIARRRRRCRSRCSCCGCAAASSRSACGWWRSSRISSSISTR